MPTREHTHKRGFPDIGRSNKHGLQNECVRAMLERSHSYDGPGFLLLVGCLAQLVQRSMCVDVRYHRCFVGCVGMEIMDSFAKPSALRTDVSGAFQ